MAASPGLAGASTRLLRGSSWSSRHPSLRSWTRSSWRRNSGALAWPSLADSHAHLDDEVFAADIDAVIARAMDAGVGLIVTVGSDLPSSERGVRLAESYPQVYAAVGFHPHFVDGLGPAELRELRRLAADRKVAAIGEIGLDFYRMHSPKERQIVAFREQLDLAAELGLPPLVHSRDAEEETWVIMSEWASAQHRETESLGVMHCFSGDADMARRYADLRFLVSIAGNVTFPKASSARQVARELPLKSMLIETDAPTLAPVPYRGKRNEPAHLKIIAEAVAETRGTSSEAIADATRNNLMRLLHPHVRDL
ncbi:MAG: TatD family hydrolase [Chloroflexi bacterium]|nr:TatD family hydrolase [Chloroflexota bacterium]